MYKRSRYPSCRELLSEVWTKAKKYDPVIQPITMLKLRKLSDDLDTHYKNYQEKETELYRSVVLLRNEVDDDITQFNEQQRMEQEKGIIVSNGNSYHDADKLNGRTIKDGDTLEIEWKNGTKSTHTINVFRHTERELEQGGSYYTTSQELSYVEVDGIQKFIRGLKARWLDDGE